MRSRHPKKAPAVVSVCDSSSAMTSLDRFKTAQDESASGFKTALAEMRSGRKTSHWIWYIFPQLQGLGQSSMARRYGIHGLPEACEYLSDPVLGERLLKITRVVVEKLSLGSRITTLMGSSVDTQKLISSVTLFHHAAGKLGPIRTCFCKSFPSACKSTAGIIGSTAEKSMTNSLSADFPKSPRHLDLFHSSFNHAARILHAPKTDAAPPDLTSFMPIPQLPGGRHSNWPTRH